jgi:2-dehydro-3-deoxyphosphooctonate aldolase (KDO 8-P synthase)
MVFNREHTRFFLIAGPCAIENREMVLETAAELKLVCSDLSIDLIFKSSFDKANRTNVSARGIGMKDGLTILQEVKDSLSLPILTDVHESWQCDEVARVADILQIPAFLSRQTDLIQAAARTGKVVNVKKGQLMAPWDMQGVINKVREAGSEKVLLTERGSSFGYGNLVVDMTSLVEMRRLGKPVVFDATHSVQKPSSQAGITGGNREMVPYLMRAALAVGIDGLFLEVHPNPPAAISDAANQLFLKDIRPLLEQAIEIDKVVKNIK